MVDYKKSKAKRTVSKDYMETIYGHPVQAIYLDDKKKWLWGVEETATGEGEFWEGYSKTKEEALKIIKRTLKREGFLSKDLEYDKKYNNYLGTIHGHPVSIEYDPTDKQWIWSVWETASDSSDSYEGNTDTKEDAFKEVEKAMKKEGW